jgi:hypothetical protein
MPPVSLRLNFCIYILKKSASETLFKTIEVNYVYKLSCMKLQRHFQNKIENFLLKRRKRSGKVRAVGDKKADMSGSVMKWSEVSDEFQRELRT